MVAQPEIATPTNSANPGSRWAEVELPVGSPPAFFLLTFAMSTPFWVLGAAIGDELLPGLPLSALMVVAPSLAALLLIYRERQARGVVRLLRRAFEQQRAASKGWLILSALLMPGVMAVEFGLLRWHGVPVPAPSFSAQTALVLLLVLFVAALSEELGWTGYALDPLQARIGALAAAVVIGMSAAAWHVLPLLQAGRTPDWIAWWALGTVAQRVIIVWLCTSAGRSVLAAALFHTMVNVTWQLFPVNGSYYDPRITALILTALAILIATGLWGRSLRGG